MFHLRYAIAIAVSPLSLYNLLFMIARQQVFAPPLTIISRPVSRGARSMAMTAPAMPTAASAPPREMVPPRGRRRDQPRASARCDMRATARRSAVPMRRVAHGRQGRALV